MEASTELKSDTTPKTEPTDAAFPQKTPPKTEPTDAAFPQTTPPKTESVRLVLLDQPKVAHYWPTIRMAVMQSMPEKSAANEVVALRILQDLRNGLAQVWFGLSDKRICFIATTKMSVDAWTETKECLIYSLFALHPMSDEQWQDTFQQLEAWAIEQKCDCLMAYTPVGHLIRLCDMLGFDTQYRRCYKELKQ